MIIVEIVDDNGELIGLNSTPESGSDLETVANKTTDQNMSIGHQPYRYDMMARFGFLGMPFYEGVEGEDQTLNEIDNKIYEFILESMKHYYKNPNKLKIDYRNTYNKDLNEAPEGINSYVKSISDGVLDIVESFIKRGVGKDNIDESNVVEDKMIDNRTEDELSKRSVDSEIKDKNIKNVAGLINKKLDKGDINKLITLLEKK